MNLELTDKVAIVTGSSRGLGLASARALLAEGCRVCICARGEARLNQAAAELRDEAGSDERVLTVSADLTQVAGVESVVRETVGWFGGLDILVNNVGRAGGGGLLEASDDDWVSAFEDTCIRRSAPPVWPCLTCKNAGGGVILIIASIWGRESGGRMTYNAVKAAEIQLGEGVGSAAGFRQHPGEQRGTWFDFVSRRLVAPAPAGGPRRNGHVRP